jgi:hypothetical protein
MKLSILIPTLDARLDAFKTLYAYLEKQVVDAGLVGEVEILFDRDSKQVSVGLKRQRMQERALGEFVSHVDDDDWVPADYVSTIARAITPELDCVGFEVECLFPEGRQLAVVSNKYTGWSENVDGYRYVRCPNHLSPIRRTHSLQVGYSDIRIGEDMDFSLRMAASGLLKNEAFFKRILYHYRYDGTEYGSESYKRKYGVYV